jgi:hypothetical protein
VNDPEPTIARRTVAAALASALGLLAGAMVAAALGSVRVLLSPGLEVASAKALLRVAVMILAEGMFWALLGGVLFLLPLAFAAFWFRPPDTPPARLGISALLLLPILVAAFPARAVDALLLAFAVWVGVRVGLRALWTRLPHS